MSVKVRDSEVQVLAQFMAFGNSIIYNKSTVKKRKVKKRYYYPDLVGTHQWALALLGLLLVFSLYWYHQRARQPSISCIFLFFR